MRGITKEQYNTLMTPIRATRISSRRQGGKELAYVEAWDIKAHLTRIFGFGNWDCEMLEYQHVNDFDYMGRDDRPMVEVVYSARMQLTIRDVEGNTLCRHSEAAVGSATGGVEGAGIGDLHDNALKSAASDALKRCAINMGSQFGLSLYDNGSRSEVIRQTIITPDGWERPQPTAEQAQRLQQSVGAQQTGEHQTAFQIAGDVAIQEGPGD